MDMIKLRRRIMLARVIEPTGNIKALISHGTEYVATDILPYSSHLYSISMMVDSIRNFDHMFGAYFSSNGDKLDMQLYAGGPKLDISMPGTSSKISIPGSQFSGYKRLYFIAPPLVMLDDQVMSMTQATLPVTVFGGYYAGNVESYKATGKFYGAKIIAPNTAEVIHELVPWLDDQSVPCIKDLKTNALYYNAGSGTFGYIDMDDVIHNV